MSPQPPTHSTTQQQTSTPMSWSSLATVAVVVAGVVAGPMVVPMVVGAAGFGTGGIVAGSWAASFMASYGGTVTAGSLCANLQSIGVNGLGQAGNAMASVVGGATTGVVAVSVNGIKNDQVADAPCAPCKKTT